MARDVEFNVTASDKTGTALAAAEAKFKASQDRIRKESKKTGDSFGDDLKKGISKSAPSIIDQVKSTFGLAGAGGSNALVYGLAAAAPLIGATLSAAIIGGAGVGGVIGGVTLAARDPRVKAAGTALGESLMGALEKDAAPFIDPVLRNIKKIEIAFQAMNGRISAIFAKSSGFLDPLVDGAIKGVSGILRGVEALVSKAKPVIDSFGRAFATVGQATGTALEIISGGSDDAANAVDDLAKVLEVVIVGTGAWIRYLTELYGVISYIPRKASEFGAALRGADKNADAAAKSSVALAAATGVLAAGQGLAAKIMLSAGEAAGKAGQQMQTYADKMNDASDKGRGLYDSQTQVGAAVARAKKAVDDNGKTLDSNSTKGRANREVLSQLAGTLIGNYDAFVKVNGEGRDAQKVAQDNRTQFIKLATAFTGSKTKAEELATQLGLIPANKNVDFHANTHDAAQAAAALKVKLDAAARNRTANVQVVINTGRLANIENRLNRLGGSMYNAGGMSWAALDSNSGVARTGGPTPVNVTSQVSVSLDGAPFYGMSVQAAQARSDREAWRQKVGRR